MTAQPKELAPLTNAYYQAQNLGMQEEIESILRPAAEVLVQSFIAQKNDTNRLQQALSAAQTFQLKELTSQAAGIARSDDTTSNTNRTGTQMVRYSNQTQS